MAELEEIPEQIPARFHPAVRLARDAWRGYYPGMEHDGTADLVVAVLYANGWLRERPRRTRRDS